MLPKRRNKEMKTQTTTAITGETKESKRKCEGRNLKSFFLAVLRIFYFILRGVE